MKKIKRCSVCDSFTLALNHCDVHTISAHPPKFNPNDPHGTYRRMWKWGLQNEGNNDN